MFNSKWHPRQFIRMMAFAILVTAAGYAQQATPELVSAPGPAVAITAPTALAVSVAPASDFYFVEQKKSARVVDAKFVTMSALLMGLTISDLEKTQHCLAAHTCVEMNPMLPHSRAGMYAVNVPINAATMYLAYRLKSAGRRSWWIAPVLETAGHLVGTGVRF